MKLLDIVQRVNALTEGALTQLWIGLRRSCGLARRIPTIWILPRSSVLHVAHELVESGRAEHGWSLPTPPDRAYESTKFSRSIICSTTARSWTFSRFEIWVYERILETAIAIHELGGLRSFAGASDRDPVPSPGRSSRHCSDRPRRCTPRSRRVGRRVCKALGSSRRSGRAAGSGTRTRRFSRRSREWRLTHNVSEPSLLDHVVSEGVVLLFFDEAEAGALVDAARGGRGPGGSRASCACSRSCVRADALVDQARADAHAARPRLHEQAPELAMWWLFFTQKMAPTVRRPPQRFQAFSRSASRCST